jgi:anti-sigma B factor antagonist
LKRELVSESDRLDINVELGEERVFMRLHGRVGIDSSPALRERLLAILQEQPPKTIVVDLTEVAFLDGAGIATLLEALKIARKRQASLCLKGLQGRILRLFEVTGLGAVFESGCKGIPPELR